MRDIKYKNKTIKMDEKTWVVIKEERKKSGLSWNMFLLDLIKQNERNTSKRKENK